MNGPVKGTASGGMHRVTIITGASAGIGAELSRVFARHGHRLALVARRRERLDALADEIAAASPGGGPRPLVVDCDLSMPGAAALIGAALAAEGLEADHLVNNAGFGLVGRAADLDRRAQLEMIDVNMRALTDLSLVFAPGLAARGGGLLNVASVAGFLPGPGSAVYYATKAFVLSFTEALHAEFGGSGLRVTALCPGPVATEFQARAGIAESTPPWPLAVSARRVAEQGYRGLANGRRVVVPGFANKIVTVLPRLLPASILLSMVERRQRRRIERPAPPA